MPERRQRGLRDFDILFDHPRTGAHRTDDSRAIEDRNAAAEDHDLSRVRVLDTVERAARLSKRRQLRCRSGEPYDTASTYGVPVKVLLLNIRNGGMIWQWQGMIYDDRMSVSDEALHRKDFALAAQADGFEFACCVEREDELKTGSGHS